MNLKYIIRFRNALNLTKNTYYSNNEIKGNNIMINCASLSAYNII